MITNYKLNKLKILREKEGITQAQLAKKLNINRSSISDCETKPPNEAPLKTLLKLSEYFGISIEDVLENDTAKSIVQEQAQTYGDKIIYHYFDTIRKSLDKIRDYLIKIETEKNLFKKEQDNLINKNNN